MDTDRLNAFLAVAAERSFSRAAGKIHRTQPAVSQAIRLLEEDLGERLFVRMARTVKLTQAGEILLDHAKEAFETLDHARVRIEALRELRGGVLSVATSDTTACYLLPEVLGAFRRRHPGVEIRILNRRSPEAVREIGAHEADIGIITMPAAPLPGLRSEPLVAREDVGICAPGHPLAKKKRAAFRDLLGYPLLLLDHGANTRSFIDRQIEESGVAPRVAMELGTIEVIKKLVQLDFGVSIVPKIAVREEARQGQLHVLRMFSKSDCRTLGIIYPAKGALSLAAHTFVEMLRRHVAGRDAV